MNGCFKPDPEIIPFESHRFIVQILPNGNLEVKPDFIPAHFKVLQTAIIYKKKYEILLEAYNKLKDGTDD